MAFDPLVNKSMTEQEILDFIVAEIRTNYFTYQSLNVFIKLNKSSGENVSEISWIKVFANFKDLIDFYYDTKFQRACIMIKFVDDRYELLCHGHFLSDRFEILPDNILNSHPSDRDGDREQKLMIPRELLEQGFGEISQSLSSTKFGKAM